MFPMRGLLMSPTDTRELVAVMRREKRSNLLRGMEGAHQTPESKLQSPGGATEKTV